MTAPAWKSHQVYPTRLFVMPTWNPYTEYAPPARHILGLSDSNGYPHQDFFAATSWLGRQNLLSTAPLHVLEILPMWHTEARLDCLD